VPPSPSAAKTPDPKIEETRRKLEQLKARRQRIEARLQYLASKQARRAETRRKILVGAIILAKVERGEMDEKALSAMLDKALSRDDDRRLFDLPTVIERR
jgi:hypothetical protein